MTFAAQGNAARPLLAVTGARYQRIYGQKDAENVAERTCASGQLAFATISNA
jgi:hypothetical protein